MFPGLVRYWRALLGEELCKATGRRGAGITSRALTFGFTPTVDPDHEQ
ncbi:hypothetical protein C8F00_4347 [Xanthomonas vasicola]